MNLGMRCGFAEECPVFAGKTEVENMPLHLLRNVFCNRGSKGWKNCTRHNRLEQGLEVDDHVTPFTE
ncbi:MAG: hypothetical protein WD052_04470 [Bacteroidales bacterium]